MGRFLKKRSSKSRNLRDIGFLAFRTDAGVSLDLPSVIGDAYDLPKDDGSTTGMSSEKREGGE